MLRCRHARAENWRRRLRVDCVLKEVICSVPVRRVSSRGLGASVVPYSAKVQWWTGRMYAQQRIDGLTVRSVAIGIDLLLSIVLPFRQHWKAASTSPGSSRPKSFVGIEYLQFVPIQYPNANVCL
jgi:hypothetical protein